MLKRVFVAVLSLLVALAALPAGGALAQGETPVIFQICSAEGVSPGDTVSLPLLIDCASGYTAHCIRLRVTFDPQMLTACSVSPGEVWNGLPMDSMKMCSLKTPGAVDISILCPTDGMSGTGCLCYINFQVAEGCADAQFIGLEVFEFFCSPVETGLQQDLEHIEIDGVIGIASGIALPGDANNDGEVNYLDISYMYLFVIGESELPEQGVVNADFNGDGIISYLDISDLYMFLISA